MQKKLNNLGKRYRGSSNMGYFYYLCNNGGKTSQKSIQYYKYS